MERIESKRKEVEDLLILNKKNQSLVMQQPASINDYWESVKQLKFVFESSDPQIKKIIKRHIHKIEVNSDEVTLHMIVGESVLPRGPKHGSRALDPSLALRMTDGLNNIVRLKESLEALNHFFNWGSNTFDKWSARLDLNQRPLAPQASALPS